MHNLYAFFIALGLAAFGFHFLSPNMNVPRLGVIIAVVCWIVAVLLSVVPVAW